jgi:hypothetical protein
VDQVLADVGLTTRDSGGKLTGEAVEVNTSGDPHHPMVNELQMSRGPAMAGGEAHRSRHDAISFAVLATR